MVTQATVVKMQQLYAGHKTVIDHAIEFPADEYERGYMTLIRDIAMGIVQPDQLSQQQKIVAMAAI